MKLNKIVVDSNKNYIYQNKFLNRFMEAYTKR